MRWRVAAGEPRAPLLVAKSKHLVVPPPHPSARSSMLDAVSKVDDDQRWALYLLKMAMLRAGSC
jgi:hypothetical protein